MNCFNNQYLLKDNEEYGDELIKLGFSPKLITSEESCKNFYDFCLENNMKFLKGSYGTLVHKKFNNYFNLSKSQKIIEKFNNLCGEYNGIMDHVNILKCKNIKNGYIITSSPYINFQTLNLCLDNYSADSKYDICIFNPYFLNYIGFVDKNSKYSPYIYNTFNLLFSDLDSEDIFNITMKIMQDIGIDPFSPYKTRRAYNKMLY